MCTRLFFSQLMHKSLGTRLDLSESLNDQLAPVVKKIVADLQIIDANSKRIIPLYYFYPNVYCPFLYRLCFGLWRIYWLTQTYI